MSANRQQRGPAWLDDYVSVDERLAKFRALHPKARIVTQLLERETLTFRAEIYLEDNDSNIPNAVGHADVEGGSGNRKQSPVEKTETAAIGRALDVMGVEGGAKPEREDAPVPTNIKTAANAPPVKARAADEDAELDTEISTLLDALGKESGSFSAYVQKTHNVRGMWFDQSVELKRTLHEYLLNLQRKAARA